jgi:hypothetical protein
LAAVAVIGVFVVRRASLTSLFPRGGKAALPTPAPSKPTPLEQELGCSGVDCLE